MPYATILDVMLILTRGEHVLLAQRQGTGYADSQWNLPSGKVEPGEHAIAAIIRESREEIGVRLGPAMLRPVVHPDVGIEDDYASRVGDVPRRLTEARAGRHPRARVVPARGSAA